MKALLLIATGVLAVLGQESKILEEFALQNVNFTAEVYKEMLKSNSSNFLVCPLSVRIVLALAHAGAGGNTAKQLAGGLHLPDDRENIKEVAHNLTPHLQVEGNYTFTSANKIYLADRYNLSDSFKKTAVEIFNSDIQNIDFSKTEEAAFEINKWVENNTYNKIKNLVKPQQLDANTAAVLINAVYFNGDWQNQFDTEFTSKRRFSVSNDQELEVDMMSTEYYFNYHYCDELKAQFLVLPYVGDDVTMTIVLPGRKDGLSALEANISKVLMQSRYDLIEVGVTIPKFKIESTIDFKAILMTLGIVDAFSELSADFKEMTANANKVFISEVTQKTFIEVTEKGTAAGAASAIIIGDRIFSQVFIADHPFIFFLKHKTIGIFFVGRFTTPEITVI